MSIHPNTPNWPPNRTKRPRLNNENCPPPTPSTPTSIAPAQQGTNLEAARLSFRTPLGEKRRFQNGFETPGPKAPTQKPYTLASSGKSRQKPFEFPIAGPLKAMKALSEVKWNELALEYGLLKEGQKLRDYQVQAANTIISRTTDVCVVAPTGAGKSTLWMLPLLAQGQGTSLVIIPFTSLGVQGENRWVCRWHQRDPICLCLLTIYL